MKRPTTRLMTRIAMVCALALAACATTYEYDPTTIGAPEGGDGRGQGQGARGEGGQGRGQAGAPAAAGLTADQALGAAQALHPALPLQFEARFAQRPFSDVF